MSALLLLLSGVAVMNSVAVYCVWQRLPQQLLLLLQCTAISIVFISYLSILPKLIRLTKQRGVYECLFIWLTGLHSLIFRCTLPKFCCSDGNWITAAVVAATLGRGIFAHFTCNPMTNRNDSPRYQENLATPGALWALCFCQWVCKRTPQK